MPSRLDQLPSFAMTPRERVTQIKTLSVFFILLLIDFAAYGNLVRYAARILIAVATSSAPSALRSNSGLLNDAKSAFICLLLVILSRHLWLPERRNLVSKGVVELLKLYPTFLLRFSVWYNGPQATLDNPNPQRRPPFRFAPLPEMVGEDTRIIRIAAVPAQNAQLRRPLRAVEKNPCHRQYMIKNHIKRTFTWNTTTEIAEAAQQVWRQVPGEKIELIEDVDQDHLTCSVCWTAYGVGERVTILPCEHWFHEECLNPWFKDHFSCPRCTVDLEWVLAVKK